MKSFSKLVLKLIGWKYAITVDMPAKCVLCIAPHTSNWDFMLGKLFYYAADKQASFLIKDSWYFFPFNHLFDSLGGVPVNRGKSGDLTLQMANEFLKRDAFQLAITPEGTRKRSPHWKKGFYYIAKKANVPVALVSLDYGLKEIRIDRIFYPTDDVEADMHEIKQWFKNVKACHPENFTIGEE